MALDAQSGNDCRRGSLILSQVNKVHHVHTIARVATMLGEDEDWLWDVANEMDQEDGLIWVYGQATTALWRSLTLASRPSPALSRFTRPILIYSSGGLPTLSELAAVYAAC